MTPAPLKGRDQAESRWCFNFLTIQSRRQSNDFFAWISIFFCTLFIVVAGMGSLWDCSMSSQLNYKTLWWSPARGMLRSPDRNSVSRFKWNVAGRNEKVEWEMAQMMASSYLWQKYDSPSVASQQRRHVICLMSSVANWQNLQFGKEHILIR